MDALTGDAAIARGQNRSVAGGGSIRPLRTVKAGLGVRGPVMEEERLGLTFPFVRPFRNLSNDFPFPLLLVRMMGPGA